MGGLDPSILVEWARLIRRKYGEKMAGVVDHPDREQVLQALLSASDRRDLILINHPIDRSLHYKLTELLEAKRRNRDACTVFLATFGGDPDAGYRAARCIRHYYKRVRLVVPGFCKSAGTLIAIAADELAVGDLGELGPLDIQVRKDSELQESSSGLDIMQAVQAVTIQTEDVFHRIMVDTRSFGLSTRLCAEFAVAVASGIAAPLIGQIDPIRLGEMQRATRVAYEYGKRLDEYTHNLKDGALERLISAYPAHGFVIDRKEAAELFHRVHTLTQVERDFCKAFWYEVGFPMAGGLPPGFIESSFQRQEVKDEYMAEAVDGRLERADSGGRGGCGEGSQDQGNSAAADQSCIRVCENVRGRRPAPEANA